jgi:hypothetical protein
MTATTSRTLRIVSLSLALLASVAFATAHTAAQENPPPNPITIPCAVNASAQVLGSTPVGDGTQTLIQARVIFGPGGSIGAHTHPGVLVLTVESGQFGFTPIGDGEMTVNRAATAETEAVSEPMVLNEETVVNPGDWFVETGMVHTGVNLSDEATTVLLTGLITTGEPLTSCVDQDATPMSVTHTDHTALVMAAHD